MITLQRFLLQLVRQSLYKGLLETGYCKKPPLIPLCFPHGLCLSFCPSSLLTALQFRIASSLLSPACSNSAYGATFVLGREFQKDKREIHSPFLAKEMRGLCLLSWEW